VPETDSCAATKTNLTAADCPSIGIAGGQSRDIAEALGLREETVRSHLKKAEAKLGVRNRTHAEALRQHLIP
jgi:DNA-binding CsgD family transcriptional regulator